MSKLNNSLSSITDLAKRLEVDEFMKLGEECFVCGSPNIYKLKKSFNFCCDDCGCIFSVPESDLIA